MQRTLISFVLLLIFTGATLSAQLREKVKAIEQRVARLDADSSYTARTLDNSWFTAQGYAMPELSQELSAYYKKDKIAMIMYALSSASSMSTTTYYFSSGELICIRTFVDLYKTFPDGSSQLERDHKGSYFIEKGDVIEYRNWGTSMYPTKNRSEAREHLLTVLEEHKQKLHKVGKTPAQR